MPTAPGSPSTLPQKKTGAAPWPQEGADIKKIILCRERGESTGRYGEVAYVTKYKLLQK